MPVQGTPLLEGTFGGLTLWACEIDSGTLKWVRTFDSSFGGPDQGFHSGGLVGYGNHLFVGGLTGQYHVIDMDRGTERARFETLSGAAVGMPIVNAQGFHMGGSGKWFTPISYAYFVEMLRP